MALQVLNTILNFVFGVLAMRSGMRMGTVHQGRAAWLLTGWVFIMTGAVAAFQNGWGTWALAEGAGSSVWNAYLQWAPGLNYSRTVALIAFGLLLLFGVLLQRNPREEIGWRTTAFVLGSGLLAGGSIGWLEGTLVPAVHFAGVTVLDTVEFLVLLLALAVGLQRDRVDRLWWLAMALYALKLALNTLWGPILVRYGHQTTWEPAIWILHFHRLPFAAAMVFLAWRRLRLARASRLVPTMYGTRY